MAADPTAALQVATKQYADTKLARGTAETITARHTFNPSTTGAPFLVGTNASGQLVTGLNADQVDGQHLADLDTRFVNASGDSMSGALVVGTDPGGTEVLRAQNLRAGATTLTGALTAPTVVAGTDPGGTEALRAGSARLNAPVLLGSVPQFTMAGDPTSALQVATKQYADTKVSKTTSETITARHTFNPSTAGAPFLLGANASGQLVTGLNADMVDGQHLSDLDTRFVNATGDSMSGALVVGSDPGGNEVLRAQSLRAGSGIVGSWRPIGVIQTTSNVGSVVFSGLGLSPPVLLRLVAVIRPSGTGAQNYHLRVNGESNSTDWAEQLSFAFGNTIAGTRTVHSSRIANFDFAGNFSVTHCSVTVAVADNGGVRASSIQSFADIQDAPALSHFGLVKNTTISTLDSLAVVGSIAAGSVFYLEYLGP
jgi:hypothetical protein